MKRIITLALSFLLAFSSTGYVKANEIAYNASLNTSPSVLLVLYDRNKAVWPTKEIWPTNAPKNNRKIIMDATKGELSKHHFTVIEDTQYYERLYQLGTDVPSIERADLLDLYKDVPCDYILLVELLNSQGGNFANDNFLGYFSLGYISTAHVKLLDVKNNRYLYNSSIYESTTWGSAKAPIRKIGERIQALIDNKLIPSQNPSLALQPAAASTSINDQKAHRIFPK
ncbi:MAG: hypothetical protein K0R55_4568 [Sporomusa sp.]|nr:hypothetical protein [Sporomusa sp.]